MTDSLIFLPLRLGVRTARASLNATRDLADLGLTTLELVERMLGDEPDSGPAPVEEPSSGPEPHEEPDSALEPLEESSSAGEPVEEPPAPPMEEPPPPVPSAPPPAPPAPPPLEQVEQVEEAVDVSAEPLLGADEPVSEEPELVEEVADPGAEDGAGASLRVAPPFPGYDELRAADVIARLSGADTAELGETELYERTHRARRTVLEAIGREIRRRPPG